jgi:hypothetical protein
MSDAKTTYFFRSNFKNMDIKSKVVYGLTLGSTILFIIAATQIRLYTSFFGDNYVRLNSRTNDIELLYPIKYTGKDFKPILDLTKNAMIDYEDLLGIENTNRKQISIAVVDNTCGPGCGELNGNRLEIESGRFDILYENVVEDNHLDHLLFYELGRIYWIFGDKLSCDDEKLNQVIHTGFAIFMRDVIIKKMGKRCASINGIAYQDYLKNKHLEFDYYKKQNEIDFEQLVNLKSVKQDDVEMKATRIFASMLNQLYENYGESSFTNEFSKNIKTCTPPENSTELYTNLFKTSTTSCKSDLRELFTEEWKIPVK